MLDNHLGKKLSYKADMHIFPVQGPGNDKFRILFKFCKIRSLLFVACQGAALCIETLIWITLMPSSYVFSCIVVLSG
jgi:hypothetical protein